MFTKIGYHGTLSNRASSILENGFEHSKKPNEWLGHGVYFFEDIEWAKTWAMNQAKKDNYKHKASVLSAVLSCDDDAFFDLDKTENMQKLQSETYMLAQRQYETGHPELKSDVMRCVACNFWKMKYKTKIFAYTFPRMKYNAIGFPVNAEQRQFCVTDNRCIKFIKLENIEGGSDYAI